MEKFKSNIKKSLVMVVCLALILPSTLLIIDSKLGELAVEGMTTSFMLGMLTAFEGMLIYLLIRFIRALRNEDKMKALYIEKNDERKEYIKKKMAMNTILMFAVGMYIAIVIAGYKNAIVFETLVYTMIGFGLILAVNKVVFLRKH